MRVGTGYSENPDSFSAGKQAASEAVSMANQKGPCDLVLLFCTARHNQQELRDGVVSTVGTTPRIFGGGAVGIITNYKFGYAGDQVGVACLWMEDSSCTVLTEGNLHKGEKETGIRLGKRLLESGVSPSSPLLLFYDAVNRTDGDLRLLLATWLLEGMEQSLGFFPNLNGAGIQGDHACSFTRQYVGEAMDEHQAIALAFSDDIRMDSVIIHGCRPASPYYTVTKSDGPALLEINGKPALQFMDELLGGAITPENYPFFLLFGLNHGERWGEYQEDDYASRLCLDIDKKRGALIMFEPDLTEGTEFRLMYRTLELDYIRPRIEAVFSQLDGREPVFAVYIDCAGRCAGYGGIDIEDAHAVQEIVKDRVPLFGIYTGAEISSIGGRPRGLDWTGVFCIFSKKAADTGEKSDGAQWETNAPNADSPQEIPLQAALKLCEQNAAKILELETRSIAIRHELELKRRGFGLLAELAVTLRKGVAEESIFKLAAQRINAALNMQKTAILLLDKQGRFVPGVLQGFSPEEKQALAGKAISVETEFLDPENPLLVTAADDLSRFAKVRQALRLPYFISTPVMIENETMAILITGRIEESPPFLSRLGHSDIETVQAIGSLLGSVWVYRKLDDATKQAQTDGMTGLLNRRTFEQRTEEALRIGLQEGRKFALATIDCDNFKCINDTYGHRAGDVALITLADSLRNNFSDGGLVARIGGDEFAVCCPITSDEISYIDKFAKFIEEWRKIPVVTSEGTLLNLTLSLGIAFAPKDGIAFDELIHHTDIALYKAKKQGRDRYAVYDETEKDNILFV